MKLAIASTAAAALTAALLVPVHAATISTRDVNSITCSGHTIVGTLKVRNPDNSLHTAAFMASNTDNKGRPKLVTKLNGTPVPSDRKFAFQLCESNGYIIGRRQNAHTQTGFLAPNNHRTKALTVGNQVSANPDNEGERVFDLVSDVEARAKFTYQSLNQWFHLYNNGSFYSLAFTGREGGLTAGFFYGPRSVHSADGQTISVQMEYQYGPLTFDGLVNPYGYALELHP